MEASVSEVEDIESNAPGTFWSSLDTREGYSSTSVSMEQNCGRNIQ
jgi:hypothetical protein